MHVAYPRPRPFAAPQRRLPIALLALLVLAAVLTPSPRTVLVTRPTSARSIAAPDFGNLPVLFVANQGQLDPQVAYTVQGSDKTLYFTLDGVTFALDAPAAHSTANDPSAPRAPLRSPPVPNSTSLQRWVVKLDFVGANPQVQPRGEAPAETIVSYFKGRPDEWRTGIPTYTRLVYSQLWPGIDLVYEGTVDRLKYEFVVQPGADPRQIRLAYRGATGVALNGAGQLAVTTPLTSFADDPPQAYQAVDGGQVAVGMAYSLDAPEADGRVSYGFQVGAYDHSRPLVLDPAVLIYAGFIGGSGDDSGESIAVDRTDCIYVSGYTGSGAFSFPVQTGPDTSYNGGSEDAFVAKVRPDGGGLVYAGYLGGAGDDDGTSIAVDSTGSAYVAGWTTSTETSFPVLGGPDLSYNGGAWDVFVAKVRPDGSGLVYAGYLGGTGNDDSQGIALGSDGSAYLTGRTTSTEASFPVLNGPDLSYNGGRDAFVAKVRPDGSGLSYAGYLGGADVDWGRGIAVDNANSAYIVGWTMSTETSFPVLGGPDVTYNGGGDAFVAKVRADGRALLYAGYLGGAGADNGSGIAVDGAGSAYLVGSTESNEASFPVLGGPDLTHNGGTGDAFVAKVRVSGSGLIYAGYLGGTGSDYASGIAVDGEGNAYLTGSTDSTEASFPVLGGPDLTYNGGTGDAFVAKVRASGSGLTYASYLGGASDDIGLAIAVGSDGSSYVAGWTSSPEPGFPVRNGPDLTYNGGIGDAFVAKISTQAVLVSSRDTLPADGSATATLTLSNAPPGLRIRLVLAPGSVGALTPASGTTDATGMFSAAMTSSSPGVAVVSAVGLEAGQTYGGSARVTFTGGPDVLPPNVGLINISGIQSRYPLEGRYLQGIPTKNPVTARVDWSGETPGYVEFTVNGAQHYYEVADISGATHTFQMGTDLREGDNTLEIVAFSQDRRQRSQIQTRHISLIPAPAWLLSVLQNGALGLVSLAGSEGAGYEYTAHVKFPSEGLSTGAPGFGPPGSTSNIAFFIGGGFRLPLKCASPAALTIEGGVQPKIELLSIELTGELRGTGTLEARAVDCEIPTVNGNFRVDLKLAGQKNWPVLVFIIDFMDPGAGTALAAVVPHSLLDGLGDLYLQGNLKGYLTADVASLVDTATALEWRNTHLGGGPGIETGYRFNMPGFEMRVYLGASGSADFWHPAPLHELSNLTFDHIALTGEAGYKTRVTWFEQEKKVKVEWRYPPASTPARIDATNVPAAWHLPGHPPSSRSTPAMLQFNTLDAPALLATNVYTYTEPALAAHPATDNALLLWVHDDSAKPVGQAQELRFSRWNGTSWSTPAAITNDAYLDGAPQVTWDAAGNAVAVWQRLNTVLPGTATWDATIAKQIEIATATYNAASGAWSPVTLLTNNAALDIAPQLARNPTGQLLAVWHQNAAGQLGGDANNPDRIMAAFTSGGWGTPAVAVDGIPGLVDLAAGNGSGRATIAYTRYLPATGTTTPTLQLFTSTWDGTAWSAPARLTNDTLGHRAPQIVYNAANQPLLIWLAGNALRVRNLATGSGSALVLPANIGSIDQLRIVRDPTGNIAAVFTAQAAQRDLYVALYDAAHNLWGQPRRLTSNAASEAYPTPALDASGRLLAAYASTAIAHETRTTTLPDSSQVVTYTLPVEGQTDLWTLAHTFQRNLTLTGDSLTLSNAHPVPGDSVTLSATISNTGDLALDGVTVGFYDGNPASGGQLLGTRSLSGPLAAGITATLALDYPIPSTGGPHTFYAVVDPANVIAESDETDNTASRAAFGPDLEISDTAVDSWGGRDVGLRVAVRNVGTSPSPATTLRFRRGTSAGTVVASNSVPALAPGAAVTVITPWSTSGLAPGSYPFAAVVNQGDFAETFTANNSAPLTLAVGPDLMVSPYTIWRAPQPDHTSIIAARVYNIGAAPAMNVTVNVYRSWKFDPLTLLFTRTIAALPAGGSAEISGVAQGTLGCGVFVQVDPAQTIAEISRSNNLAALSGDGTPCMAWQTYMSLMKR